MSPSFEVRPYGQLEVKAATEDHDGTNGIKAANGIKGLQGADGTNGTKLTTLSETSAGNQFNYEPGRTLPVDYANYPHTDYMPDFPNVKWPALTEFTYNDPGRRGDPAFRNLLADATDVFDFNPKIGTEIHGVRLSKLTPAQKDDLARLIAIRGVVFFRNQDDLDVDAQMTLGEHFGRLYRHHVSSLPINGQHDALVVYRSEKDQDMRAMFTPAFNWHADGSFEIQPPAYTSLKVLSGPPRGGGGDTLWSSQYAAYDVLSPSMQKYLEGLKGVHSADLQAMGNVAMNRAVRRDPITTEQPLVRTHPVTGWKYLFYNPGFVTKIAGVPKLENDHIIAYLNEVISSTNENMCRFQWNTNDVAIWDNRSCCHTATYGYHPHRRHAIRVTVQGEKPYFEPSSKSQEEEFIAKHGLVPVDKNCHGLVNWND